MITLKQVIADIKNGKSQNIYLCSKSLWWTHLESDAIDAHFSGLEFVKNKNIFKIINNNVTEFYSPIGEPIIKNNNALKFMMQTQMRPQHCGKHGLNAFMKAHHQNNSKHFFNKWQRYNDLIDKELELKVVQIKKT